MDLFHFLAQFVRDETALTENKLNLTCFAKNKESQYSRPDTNLYNKTFNKKTFVIKLNVMFPVEGKLTLVATQIHVLYFYEHFNTRKGRNGYSKARED